MRVSIVKSPRESRRGSDVQRLQAVALFAELDTSTLERIATAATVRRYEVDEHITIEGEPCEAGYFILEGSVRVYRVSPEGRQQVLATLGPGQAFNTVPLFLPEGTNAAHTVALAPTTACVLPKQDFLILVANCGDLAKVVIQDFAERLVHLTDLVAGLSLYSVQQRLARFLLDTAPGNRVRLSGLPARQRAMGAHPEGRRWTQQEIAVHLGTVRDVVGRELRALENAGAIRLERGRIVLLDRATLERIAGY
jgi:CRP-like cAMP-binding protein